MEATPAPAPSRLRPTLLALAETSLALALSVLVALVVTLPLLPEIAVASVPLRWAVDEDAPAADREALERRVERLALGEHVSIGIEGGEERLILEDLVEREGWEVELREALERSGYRPVDPEVEHRPLLTEDFGSFAPRDIALLLSIQSVVFLLVGGALGRWRAPRLPRAGRAGLLAVAGWSVAGAVASLVVTATITKILELVGMPVEEQAWVLELAKKPEVVLFLSPWLVLLGPLSEEIFFRFYAFRLLRSAAGFPTALVVSAVMFALVHGNLSGFLVYLSIGVVLAGLYERTGTIATPILAHALYNGMTLAALLLLGLR